MLKYRLSLLILVCFFWASAAQGQNFLDEHKIKALKGLKVVHPVLRANVTGFKVLSHDEIFDYLEFSLRQRIPELQYGKEGGNMLELSYITDPAGGLIEITVYRWVTVIATGEDIIANVWNDKRVFMGGRPERKSMREVIDEIVLQLALDFMRANQKGERK
jgi:hypothetical protein